MGKMQFKPSYMCTIYAHLINAFYFQHLQQQKYFDSGDYNMAKQGKKPIAPGQKLLLGGGTGQAHPTPDSVPARKTSLIQGKLS